MRLQGWCQIASLRRGGTDGVPGQDGSEVQKGKGAVALYRHIRFCPFLLAAVDLGQTFTCHDRTMVHDR